MVSFVLKLLVMLVICYALVEFHEYVHQTNCEYAGGNATRMNFGTTLCQMEENDLKAQIHWFDVMNELVSSILFPVMIFWMVTWVTKHEP